ncbi:outer membrane lipoprotein-sorting protein [Microbulbifer bruguierae]|uniref:Outer membrane lipoprotein-sorting protein n=1 Tax=Microbulbifer bruguierae TaxID=3029061 RepID=A0ABY8NF68_9GAMM|nr:outer membrane lipoprotein-sorting protein [Microbulbifer bruguierae]WGL17335.1 outer membrane lipoprotein-sorting protein [Microbulbifer bruguierae]
MTHPNSAVTAYFRFVRRYPKTLVLISLVALIALCSSLPQLTKDTRGDAFMDPGNPALIYRDKVKQQFGLSDPYVIAVITEQDHGVYAPPVLELVEWLSDKSRELENIDPDRVVSLATENNIQGSTSGMEVTPFFDPRPTTKEQSDRLRQAIEDFPLYQGKLVSRDGRATLIIAEMLDEDQAEATYTRLQKLIEQAPHVDGVTLHLAGEGAVAGFLGSYIDSDAGRLNPIAGLIITLIIALAFRRLAPALLANVIIAASVLTTLSIMAVSKTPFYVITNALPVILIGISVADAIHIFSRYYELQLDKPETARSELVIETMLDMWRPITLTTLTTIAGFVGLYFASNMPPFKYMGLFTALGVTIAWLFSMLFLPAALTWLQPKVSAGFLHSRHRRNELFASMMQKLGGLGIRHPGLTLGTGVAMALTGFIAASQLKVDEDRIETFHHSEPIYQADRAINTYFDGSNNLDIVIETDSNEGLFAPEVLQKMQALQTYALSLPHVNNATSIVDYLKQMNRVLQDGQRDAYRLPETREAVAQYFLLYSASSDPTDFEEEVDYDYRQANIRLLLDSAAYRHTRPVVESLQRFIEQNFNEPGLSATLSGRVTVNYHWIRGIGDTHFYSLLIALVLVWLVAALLFRSALAGVYALLPVCASILLIYSTMAMTGISLGIGTSMFASVAIGLGVDFAIHTLDRIKSRLQILATTQHTITADELDRELLAIFPTTGRALLFNFLAIACGFGVLMSSKVVPLNNFGTIVALAVTTSFIASVMLLPAMIKLFRPRFALGSLSIAEHSGYGAKATANPADMGRLLSVLFGALVLSGGLSIASPNAVAEISLENSWPDTQWIVDQVNGRDDGEQVSRTLTMTLTDRNGKQRVRETRGFRKYYDKEKRSVLFYTSPSIVKDTAFLTYDYPQAENRDDDQWLYLPALRKVRRISASDRGDHFLGTDFTYEDIKKEGRMEPADFAYKVVGKETANNRDLFHMEGVPHTQSIAEELGYGRTELWVDSQWWIVVKAQFWDIRGNLLKSLQVKDIRPVDGILTRHTMIMDNHKTGHRSEFVFSDVDYLTPVDDSLFRQRSLGRGF